MEKIVNYAEHLNKCTTLRAKKILFYGTEMTTLILYLARMMVLIKKKVLVIDSTKDGCLSEYLPNLSDRKNEIICRGVAFLRTDKCSVEMESYYDVIIYLNGIQRNPEIERECDSIFVVTDMKKRNIRKLEVFLNDFELRFILIFLDYIESNYLEFCIRQKRLQIIEQYFIPLSEKDYSCSLKIQYNSNFNLLELSYPYQMMLTKIVKQLFPEYTEFVLRTRCAN